MTNPGILFLIPNVIDDENPAGFLPSYVLEKVKHIRHFVFESEKAGRALIKKLAIDTPQNEVLIELWNEHSDKNQAAKLLAPLMQGYDVGLASDAGIPCVADPGNEVVLAAHQKGIKVIPLPGSSSIFMALMASGLGGQNFAFHGYLAIDKTSRALKIKEMENISDKWKQTQLFMEAPYRNGHLFDDLLKNCPATTKLCIALSISSPNELIQTKTIGEWRKSEPPNLHKKPCVFVLYA